MAGSRSLGSWTFRPAAPADRRGDDSPSFRSRLTAALRAGHGGGVGFALRFTSGIGASLELTAVDPGGIRWAERVLAPVYDRNQWQFSWNRRAGAPAGEGWVGHRSRAWPDPIRTPVDGIPIADALVLALTALAPGAVVEWSLRPIALGHPSWWEFAPPSSEGPARSPRSTERTARPPGLDAPRWGERPPFWNASVRLVCEAPRWDPQWGSRVARVMESATRSAAGNGLRFHRTRWRRVNTHVGFPMSDAEVAATLPGPSCPVPEAGGAPDLRGGRILPLGRTSAGVVIGPLLEPTQGRHLAILGETGMGKSSLLVALGRRIAVDSGVILFDPLGETAHALRRQLSESGARRLIWIDPGGAVGLNALDTNEGTGMAEEARRERHLNDLVHSLQRVRTGRYVSAGFWGPRLEEMLTRALRAASALPGGTLRDAHALLSSGGRGFRVVPPEAIEAVRDLSDRIRSRPDDAEGARRLLHEVVQNPILARMLCARNPSLRAAELVAPGRIVLISGEGATVGESTARYLLSVLLALVWSELLARATRAKSFVVLDEAQWFAHESLGEMLRLGRRKNVHVILATQAVGSLPEGINEAVWTNVADFVAFRGSPQEAREFGRLAPGVLPESLLSLPRGHAAALLGKGNSVHWIRTARAPEGPTPRIPDSGSDCFAVPPAANDRPRETPPIGDPGSGTVGSPVGSQEVLRAIARRIARADAADPICISLSELRREVDPDGEAVRAAGGMLGRHRAIVRTDRDASGALWWVDAERFARVLSESFLEDTKSDSKSPQPS